MRAALSVVVSWSMGVAMLACTAPSTPAGQADASADAPAAKVTWHGHAKPVLDRYCTTCHEPPFQPPESMVCMAILFQP